MYSIRIQYYIVDTLVADIATTDELEDALDRVKELGEKYRVQAIRIVHECGKY